MNQKIYKMGAWAAFGQSFIYIIGFVLLVSVLNPENAGAFSAIERLSFLTENKQLYQTWILIIYVVFGVILVSLTYSLLSLLKENQSPMAGIASIFGYIWSVLVIACGMVTNIGLDSAIKISSENQEQAAQLWLTIETFQNGLGGGVEVVGGIWVFLVSLAALKANQLGKGLNILGLVVGSAGILTAIPGLSELGAIFGLLQIVWFIWLGIHFKLQAKSST